MFWALRETSVDMLACLLLRVILDARRQRLPAVAINYFGKGVGSRGWERKPGREDLTFGSCWMSCCYLPSQLHACLPCLALPCHATLFFSLLLISFSLLHQFPWRTDGRMTKFFPFFATVNLLLVRPQTLEQASALLRGSVCLARRNHCCRLCIPASNQYSMLALLSVPPPHLHGGGNVEFR